MQKQEPVIHATGFSDKDLYSWVVAKASSLKQLKDLVMEKEQLEKHIADLDNRIKSATAGACLNVVGGNESITTRNGSKSVGEAAETPDLLIVSSEVLRVLKSELYTRGIKPTPGNLRWVMGIIEKSLLDFDFLSEFLAQE
ncbi:hypothetical protein [Serratia symbiotica]|uniref:Uncharacterized protein n=1 Tax=Serratia symbiotica SCt-VLC TaxID=1347341 RepID=A0A068RAW8_9GAMM|nr:hypothetical protein [Serratia symbiotica]CDG47649.1 hypothetical protein SCTVLC_0905 [Serratia symbiotica SCt-VLC]